MLCRVRRIAVPSCKWQAATRPVLSPKLPEPQKYVERLSCWAVSRGSGFLFHLLLVLWGSKYLSTRIPGCCKVSFFRKVFNVLTNEDPLIFRFKDLHIPGAPGNPPTMNNYNPRFLIGFLGGTQLSTGVAV